MNLKLFGGAALAFVLAPMLAPLAHADGWYATGHIGAVTDASADVYGNEFQFDGSTFGGGLGTAIGPIRVEAGYDRSSFDLFGGIVTADADIFSASGFLDFPVTSRAGLFAGGGIDYANATLDLGGVYSVDGRAWGYHLAGGATYQFAPNIIGEVRVTRTDLGSLEFNGLETDVVTWGTTAGLRLTL